MPNLELKIISSLEKCLWNEKLGDKKEKKEFFIFKNERLSFQIAYYNSAVEPRVPHCPVKVEGSASEYATLRQVVSVPVMFPCRRLYKEGTRAVSRSASALAL